MHDNPDDPRRRQLLQALALGAFAPATLGVAAGAKAQGLGKVPRRLGSNRSIYSLRGSVRVNGKAANENTRIRPGDVVETGRSSKVIFAVNTSAFILRSQAHLRIEGDSKVIQALRILAGGLLSVFGRDPPRVATPLVTIGIRGTGLYVESEPDRSYVCTCYGKSQLTATTDPSSMEQIVSRHHNAPRYILATGATGQRIRKAPFKNHTDLELRIIEALVGRTPPFAFRFDSYDRPRRSDY